MAFSSEHGKVLEEVRTQIIALSLTGIPNANVVITDIPVYKHRAVAGLPAVEISPFGRETANPNEGTNVDDDFGFPAFITLLDAANQEIDDDKLDQRLLWRQQIRHRFIHRRLAVTGLDTFDCRFIPSSIVDPSSWGRANLWISSFRLEFFARIRGSRAS